MAEQEQTDTHNQDLALLLESIRLRQTEVNPPIRYALMRTIEAQADRLGISLHAFMEHEGGRDHGR